MFIILLSCFCAYSQTTPAFCGNLRTQVLADNSYTVTCIVELASLPFEGANEPTECLNTNRIGVFQNGTILGEFELLVGNCVRYDAFFPYHKSITPGTVTNPIDLASPFEPDHCNGAWSSAKYKITFLISPTGEKYSFYFNNLDIHYEKSNWHGRNVYGNDWTFQYNSALTLGSRVEIWGKNNINVDTLYGTVSTSDTANGMPTREFKVWEMLYGRQQPFGRNFFARTTPFGISPQYIDSGFTRNLILGTTVILDTVYNNSGANDKYGYNTVDVNGGGGGGQFGYHYYFSNPPIDSSDNDMGNTYTTPAWFYFDENENLNYGTKITAASGDTLWLKRRKVLWITGIEDILNPGIYRGDTIHFKSGSTLILEPSAELEACRGGVIIYETGSNVLWNEHTCNSAENGSQIVIKGGGSFVVNNSGFIQIKNGGTLELTAGTQLIFDGSGSKLKLNSGSTVKLGQGASIEFKNGAYLDAYGSTFSSLNSGDVWNGIKFDKSGTDNITYCSFSGANTYIEVLNDAVSSGNKKTITGNTFNNGLVRLENISKCSISDNNFNSPTGSNDLLQITNNIPFSPASWNLHIINNWFKGGGNFQLNLRGYSGNIPSFYIFNNRFQGGAVFGMYCYNISGSLKYSNFTSSDYSVGLDMANSSLDLYGNVIKSTGSNTIWVKPNSTARLAPVASGAFTPQLEWYGGVNKITSVSSNCVYFQPNGQVLTDRGSNCFNLGNLSNFHIIGDYSSGNCSGFTYSSTRNLWNEGCSPNFNITCNQNQAAVEYNPCISICPSTGNPAINQIGSYITSVGDNIFDTLLITTDFGSGEGGGESGSNSSEIRKSANEDRALYSQILRNKRDKEYLSAIIKCKNIINDYDTSKYVNPSLDELYQNYQNIDTSGNTLILFTELKSYIEQKMQQYESNTSFVEKAYGYFLKCLIKNGLYMDAIAGYENIMNNHPDATARLFACWDRAAVVLLLGHGGGQSDMFMKNYEQKIKRLFDKNPAHKIAKDIFEKTDRINKSEFPDDYVKETKDEDSKITERVSRFNPSSIKELEEKMANDNDLLLELSIKRSEKQQVLNIPKIFKLHQNYPNPFNPVTMIKYDIPRDNLVTIKIYDILGKEILNSSEFNKAGSYEVRFDGTNFASGLYFYSLEAGNFRDTKKMVLIK